MVGRPLTVHQGEQTRSNDRTDVLRGSLQAGRCPDFFGWSLKVDRCLRCGRKRPLRNAKEHDCGGDQPDGSCAVDKKKEDASGQGGACAYDKGSAKPFRAYTAYR